MTTLCECWRCKKSRQESRSPSAAIDVAVYGVAGVAPPAVPVAVPIAHDHAIDLILPLSRIEDKLERIEDSVTRLEALIKVLALPAGDEPVTPEPVTPAVQP
jgi:hypothetical protein